MLGPVANIWRGEVLKAEPQTSPAGDSGGLFGPVPTRLLACVLLAALCIIAFWLAPVQLGNQPRLTLLIFAFAVIGWTLTRLADATVALAAAVALVMAGVVDKGRLYAALGHELIWLLLAAFAIGSVLRRTTLMQRFALAALAPARSVSGLVYLLTLVIGATAFVMPSTAGRAAVLLPVFLALADALDDPRLVRALALLFPSVILLSACAALTGAGAHLVGLEYIALLPGPRTIGYLEWAVLAVPVALVSSLAAATLILRLFLTAEERAAAPKLPRIDRRPLDGQEWAIVTVVAATVLAWVTSDWHGLGIGLVGVLAALVLTLPGVSGTGLKAALSGVEWELILFLAATMVIGDALMTSGVATSISGWLTSPLPDWTLIKPAAAGVLVAAVAVLMHLIVLSRTARAAVLIPAFALPVASFGHDAVTLILLTVIGTGFSQTLTVSSKPVAIYASLDRPTYAPRDLMTLSLTLAPVFLAVLLASALYWWPQAGFAIGR
jgi:di/tricarboxylate transporter